MTDNGPNSDQFFRTQHRHVRRCLKEAKAVVVIWLVQLVYTVAVMACTGYPSADERPAEPALVWGMPAWVFWGLFFPWFVQVGVVWWFALKFLKDDEPYHEFPLHDDRDSSETRFPTGRG